MYPDIKTYQKLNAIYDIIPVHTKFYNDYFTPIAIFEKLVSLDPDFLLESAGPHQQDGQYSYIGLDCKRGSYPVDALNKMNTLIEKSYFDSTLPPFYNGHVGYISYEAIEKIHPVQLSKKSDINHIQLLHAKVMVVMDHVSNEVYIVNNTNTLTETYEDAVQTITKIKKLICDQLLKNDFKKLNGILKVESNMTYGAYEKMINQAKTYIREGDIFQVVLSQQFSAPLEVEPFEIYKSVRRENPSPYLSYIKFEGFTSICSSPEMLIKSVNKTIHTVPIAGTRAVKNDGKDHIRAQELQNDQKELSEHLMLVDLSRNDLNRVAQPGSVEVHNFCQLKKFSRVMHLTSEVKATLKDSETSMKALLSAFPAGTVSGAPKVRAMEIIDELESSTRNLYAGTIFYMNYDMSINSCIAIRTMLLTDRITIQSGSGIVLDSSPEDEYKETIHKAKALFNALNNLYEGGLAYDFNHR